MDNIFNPDWHDHLDIEDAANRPDLTHSLDGNALFEQHTHTEWTQDNHSLEWQDHQQFTTPEPGLDQFSQVPSPEWDNSAHSFVNDAWHNYQEPSTFNPTDFNSNQDQFIPSNDTWQNWHQESTSNDTWQDSPAQADFTTTDTNEHSFTAMQRSGSSWGDFHQDEAKNSQEWSDWEKKNAEHHTEWAEWQAKNGHLDEAESHLKSAKDHLDSAADWQKSADNHLDSASRS